MPSGALLLPFSFLLIGTRLTVHFLIPRPPFHPGGTASHRSPLPPLVSLMSFSQKQKALIHWWTGHWGAVSSTASETSNSQSNKKICFGVIAASLTPEALHKLTYHQVGCHSLPRCWNRGVLLTNGSKRKDKPWVESGNRKTKGRILDVAHWNIYSSKGLSSQPLLMSLTSLLLGKEVKASALLCDHLSASVETLLMTGPAQRGGKPRHSSAVIWWKQQIKPSMLEYSLWVPRRPS